MFDQFITTIYSGKIHTEITRALLKGNKIIPVFHTFQIGEDSLKNASDIYFENNTIPSDEVLVTSVHPSKAVFQQLEMPSVKNKKNFLRIANFKIATQFSLSPEETIVSPLTSVNAIQSGIVPTIAVARNTVLKERLSVLRKLGFPEPDIVDINPFPIMKTTPEKVLEGFSFVFLVDYDFSVFIAMKQREIVGLNYIDDGFSEILENIDSDFSFDSDEVVLRFFTSIANIEESLVEKFAEILESILGYQLRMYITNTLSNSPNMTQSEEEAYNKVFIRSQSNLSTAIYKESLSRILEGEKIVNSLPLKYDKAITPSFSSQGMLLRGGEYLGRHKLTFKEAVNKDV
ncbi:MAG: hypothetical protein R6U52_03495 [Kosmotogaceae bacterium]